VRAYILCMKKMPRPLSKATARALVINSSRDISIVPWFLFLFRISYLKVISESARELLLPILAGGSREDQIEISCVLVFY
jgi:hypothetical protein